MARKKTTNNTTPSQDAMLEHLAYLVLHQNRPACWRDFQKFMVDGQAYSLKQGTIRNNLSYLRRLGLIEFSYRSIDAYYTLPGEINRKGNTMTDPHARVCKPDLAALIQRMAFDTPAAHDIHLRFNVFLIWQTLSVFASPTSFIMNITDDAVAAARSHASLTITRRPRVILSTRPVSNDLVLPVMLLDNEIKGMVTVHKNDTVSVILSCSGSPIRFDIGGLVRLSSSLARIEERLIALIDIAQGQRLSSTAPLSSSSSSSNPAATEEPSLIAETQKGCAAEKKILFVPEYGSWIVTMWHIGRDSIQRYTGEKFEVAWEDFAGEWIRAYSKEVVVGRPGANRGKARKRRLVRLEGQEYPNDRLRVAVEHKLSLVIAPHMHS